MKIVSGLGSIDEYESFVKAGADEFYAGYVPLEWSLSYGNQNPLNRREVRNYNVQLGSLEELKILRNMIEFYGVPVKLTLNSLYYTEEQYERIANLVETCMNIGFVTYIIADPALILYLRERKLPCRIHLSGETAEVNSLSIRRFEKYDIERVIFHRKNSLEDMSSCIRKNNQKIKEYEAFILNEMCHYTGAFCNSLHCDELCPICREEYQLGTYYNKKQPEISMGNENVEETQSEEYLIGQTGCGLCALPELKKAGVTHLKIVGRGNYVEYARKDIVHMKEALHILEETNEAEFIEAMKRNIFPDGCSEYCYYRN